MREASLALEQEANKQRIEMERQAREERMEADKERMKLESEFRQQELEQQRQFQQQLSRDRQPGQQAGAQRVKSQGGSGRGLFSNRAPGETASGIDNIMDPTTLTIIGIVLTVATTGLTLFRGN